MMALLLSSPDLCPLFWTGYFNANMDNINEDHEGDYSRSDQHHTIQPVWMLGSTSLLANSAHHQSPVCVLVGQ